MPSKFENMSREEQDKYLLEHWKRITQIAAQNPQETGKISQYINSLLHENRSETSRKRPWKVSPRKASEKSLRIICIDPGTIQYIGADGQYYEAFGLDHNGDPLLEFCEVYTTPGPRVDAHGRIMYYVNEIGQQFCAQRFAVLKNKRNKKQ